MYIIYFSFQWIAEGIHDPQLASMAMATLGISGELVGTNQFPTDQALYGNLQLRAELLHEVLQGERRDSDFSYVSESGSNMGMKHTWIGVCIYIYVYL